MDNGTMLINDYTVRVQVKEVHGTYQSDAQFPVYPTYAALISGPFFTIKTRPDRDRSTMIKHLEQLHVSFDDLFPKILEPK